jgi:hypothetical protein
MAFWTYQVTQEFALLDFVHTDLYEQYRVLEKTTQNMVSQANNEIEGKLEQRRVGRRCIVAESLPTEALREKISSMCDTAARVHS